MARMYLNRLQNTDDFTLSLCIKFTENDLHIKIYYMYDIRLVCNRRTVFFRLYHFISLVKLKWKLTTNTKEDPPIHIFNAIKIHSADFCCKKTFFMTRNECVCVCCVEVRIDWIFIIAYKLHSMQEKTNRKKNLHHTNLITNCPKWLVAPFKSKFIGMF